jgi:hypothetical protein
MVKGGYLSILVTKLFETVGVSVVVAVLFTYVSSNIDFVGKIQEILESIVVKRNFLGGIDPSAKKEALKSLIQPSQTEINNYPNIGNYYGHFINNALDIGKKSIRSNYKINAKASIQNGKVTVSGTSTYRLYPSAEGFQPIKIGFTNSKTESRALKCIITTPNGSREEYPKPESDSTDSTIPYLELIEVSAAKSDTGEKKNSTSIPIESISKGCNHLDVQLSFVEYGDDNHILFSFKTLLPTDGLNFTLYYSDDLKVSDYDIFVVDAKYHVDINEATKEMNINCSQWINEGAGFSVVIQKCNLKFNTTNL